MADCMQEWPEPVVRVQAVAESGLAAIPGCYVKPPRDRPAAQHLATAAGGGDDDVLQEPLDTSIPVIDLGELVAAADEEGRMSLITEAVAAACREWGFFQVVNHGVAPELMRAAREAWRGFFRLPITAKQQYANLPRMYEGYGSRVGVQKGGPLDWGDYYFLHLAPEAAKSPDKYWPTNPAICRAAAVMVLATVMVLAAAVMLSGAAFAMDVGSSSSGGVGGSGLVGSVGGDGGLVRSNVGSSSSGGVGGSGLVGSVGGNGTAPCCSAPSTSTTTSAAPCCSAPSSSTATCGDRRTREHEDAIGQREGHEFRLVVNSATTISVAARVSRELCATDSMVGSSVGGDSTMGSSGGGNGRMGRSFGGDGGQGDGGLLLPVMQDQFHGLDVGEYSVVGESDSLFMEQHRRNMHCIFELQNTFDAWLDNMDNNLGLEDEADMINDGVDNVEVVAMNGVEDVAVAMDGHEAHQFDVLTAGEEVIFDIMFDIHHPNFYRDDNGVYRYRAD